MSTLKIIFLVVYTCAFTFARNGTGSRTRNYRPNRHQTNGYYYSKPAIPFHYPEHQLAHSGNGTGSRSRNYRPNRHKTNGYFYSKPAIPFHYPEHQLAHSGIEPGERISEFKCRRVYKRAVSYVAGGRNVVHNEFPYMAAIGWELPNGGYEYLCGGTLITFNFVVTAAHCRSKRGQKPSVVLTGGGSLNSSTDLSKPIGISNIFVHQAYKRKQIYNDIALIKLNRTSKHTPACLWPVETINYRTATVIGYGQTGLDYFGSNDLLKADVQLVSNEVCDEFYPPKYRQEEGLKSNQLCAGDFNRVRDTCPGDSGGPILVLKPAGHRGTKTPYILGITSYGPRCTSGIPQIYTRISSHLDWIESIVWPSE